MVIMRCSNMRTVVVNIRRIARGLIVSGCSFGDQVVGGNGCFGLGRDSAQAQEDERDKE